MQITHKSGFTIIELLVTIVVIAILATIGVVAYTSIQNRAKYTAVLTSFDAWEKGLVLHRAAEGDFPLPVGSQDAYTCLGKLEDYPATEVFHEGECMQVIDGEGNPLGNLGYTFNQEVNDKISQHISLPTVTAPTTQMNFGTVSLVARGFLYQYSVSTINRGGQLSYRLYDGAECGRGYKAVIDQASGHIGEPIYMCGIKFEAQ